MRRLKQFLAVMLAAIAGHGLAATPAEAFAFNNAYCGSGLRGSGTPAPDNDVRRWWDTIQKYHNVNLSQTASLGFYRARDWDVYETVRYYGVKSGGSWSMDITFRCTSGASGYHDGRSPDYS